MDDEDRDFTIGDLEVEEEGKGHLPAATGLVGNEEPILGGDATHEKNVGIQHLAISASLSSEIGSQWSANGAGSSSNEGSGRAMFPALWPFGGKAETMGLSGRNHFRGAGLNADDVELQSSDSDSDSDEGNHEFGSGGHFEAPGEKRRLSVTTEAKRRTSLEDEDEDEDEEVVHVAMTEAHAEAEGRPEAGAEVDDGEMVEIQHAEMQGVEDK